GFSRDWSSDVCSSDLLAEALRAGGAEAVTAALPLHDPEAMRQGLERLPALDLAAAVLSAAPVPPVQPFLKHRDADFREQLLPTVDRKASGRESREDRR